MFIYRPTTLDATFRYLWRKNVGPGGTNINHHDSDLEFTRGYSTTNMAAFSTGDIISAGNWYITFFVDGGVGVAPRIYHAQLGNTLTEPSYAQQDTPVGTLGTDASASALVGFRDSTRRFIGDIAVVSVWEEVLSLGQCKAQYYRVALTANFRLYCHLGYAGTGTQPDWSGNFNSGAVTGATVAPHVSLGPSFGFDSDWQGAFTAAVGGLSIPVAMNSYRQRYQSVV
ncbi:hypothetical protein LCGC14_2070350 [marine sediment metagenome]|uniref:Uncharacterized protein n=1 Tax=marine sediment metagenome TaxID=412755 RepID=A0A0F9EIH9_9ZZZZ